VPTSSRVDTEQIFGPMRSVARVASYEDGGALINSGAFGNGTAVRWLCIDRREARDWGDLSDDEIAALAEVHVRRGEE
jgi:acyl-CoA reductase-like NAD-dependent aldehyde dehydrogenase